MFVGNSYLFGKRLDGTWFQNGRSLDFIGSIFCQKDVTLMYLTQTNLIRGLSKREYLKLCMMCFSAKISTMSRCIIFVGITLQKKALKVYFKFDSTFNFKEKQPRQ